MSLDYCERARGYLRNRKLVLWILEAMSRKPTKYDDVVQAAVKYAPLKPMFERALQGLLPTDEELNEKPEWHYYPMRGVICHYLGNDVSTLELFFLRHPDLRDASENEFLESVRTFFSERNRLMKKWEDLEPEIQLIREQFLEKLDKVTKKGRRSGSVKIVYPLLRKWIVESVDPFEEWDSAWEIKLSVRWYGCHSSVLRKVELKQIDKDTDELSVKIWEETVSSP